MINGLNLLALVASQSCAEWGLWPYTAQALPTALHSLDIYMSAQKWSDPTYSLEPFHYAFFSMQRKIQDSCGGHGFVMGSLYLEEAPQVIAEYRRISAFFPEK